MKSSTCIHDIKLQNGLENQRNTIQEFIYKCRVKMQVNFQASVTP